MPQENDASAGGEPTSTPRRRTRPAQAFPSERSIADAAEILAFANLALATSQSLAQTILDMPSRMQADSVVRLATSARAAVQVLTERHDDEDPSAPARCSSSPY